MTSYDALIIGAGVAGLTAAQVALAVGWRTQVLDKGRSVGGRLATRWLGDRANLVDHGAQFFTVRSLMFQQRVAQARAAGVVREWSRGWGGHADGHPRYMAPGGLNALARYWARNVPVVLNATVSSVHPTPAGWQVHTAEGQLWQAQRVLCTAPAPQTLAMLHAGGVTLDPADQARLQAITYHPCLCALFRLNTAARLPEPGALQHPTLDISWLADNQRKGISAAPLLTVHANPAYSRVHYADPEEAILADLWAAVRPWVSDLAPVEQQLKRWRYAQPETSHTQRTLRLAGVPPFFVAGDAFGSARVEGAALSGWAAATALLRA